MDTGLESIDPAAITDVVRQDVRDPSFELLSWSVKPLRYERIIETTGGLSIVSGTGRHARAAPMAHPGGAAGDRNSGRSETSWRVVLKVVNRPGRGGGNSAGDWDDPRAWLYWKREPLSFQSGMLSGLPPGLRAPRSYGVVDREEGAWIWMEYIEEPPDRRWSLEEFHRAARFMGRFGAAFLCGRQIPTQPWLCPAFFRSLHGDGGWWATHMDPASPASVWENPLVVQGFGEALRSRILRIWAEKQALFDAVDALPTVFCHNDLHRRNLVGIADSKAQDLVGLDWAFCGPGAVGMDAGELVASSTYLFESEPDRIAELETTVLDGYQAGLRDGGWSGDRELARTGYLLSAVLWMGATLPGWTAYLLGGGSTIDAAAVFGRPAGEILSGWVTLADFILERADMLRSLLRRAG